MASYDPMRLAMGRGAIAAAIQLGVNVASGAPLNQSQLMAAGVLGGSVVVGEIVSTQLVFPAEKLVKLGGSRTMNQMIVEPIVTGLVFAAAAQQFGGAPRFEPLLVAQGAAYELAAGFAAPMLGIGVAGEGDQVDNSSSL